MSQTTLQQRLGSGFHAKTTAEEVMRGIDLTGRTAIVTGGYSGIGTETTRALAGAGATVIVPARRPDTAKQELADHGIDAEIDELDLSDLDSVKAFAQRFNERHDSLDLLINNAGVMASQLFRTKQGHEGQFGTNHLGHFVLTNLLWPALVNAPHGARVVSLSSLAHRQSPIRWDDVDWHTTEYDKWKAYGQAKTANSLFAVHLDALGQDRNIRAFAVHPGGILTPLQRHLSKEEMIGYGWIDEAGNPLQDFKTPSQGAATTLWCATSGQLNGRGGVYCCDADVADLVEEGQKIVAGAGVYPHAVDPDEAAKLWTLSVDLTGVDAFAAR